MRIEDTIAVIQARMTSTRLPGKILKPFSNGKCLLDMQVETLLRCFDKTQIYIATTTNPDDDPVEKRYSGLVQIFRGSESDVLSRFTKIAQKSPHPLITRIVSDNPFIFAEGIFSLVESHAKTVADYSTFSIQGKPAMLLPTGLFAEVVGADALKRAARIADPLDREHVTYAIYTRLKDLFRINIIDAASSYPLLANDGLRFTVDTPEDFDFIDRIISDLDLKGVIDYQTVIQIIDHINKHNLTQKMKMENQRAINSKAYSPTIDRQAETKP